MDALVARLRPEVDRPRRRRDPLAGARAGRARAGVRRQRGRHAGAARGRPAARRRHLRVREQRGRLRPATAPAGRRRRHARSGPTACTPSPSSPASSSASATPRGRAAGADRPARHRLRSRRACVGRPQRRLGGDPGRGGRGGGDRHGGHGGAPAPLRVAGAEVARDFVHAADAADAFWWLAVGADLPPGPFLVGAARAEPLSVALDALASAAPAFRWIAAAPDAADLVQTAAHARAGMDLGPLERATPWRRRFGLGQGAVDTLAWALTQAALLEPELASGPPRRRRGWSASCWRSWARTPRPRRRWRRWRARCRARSRGCRRPGRRASAARRRRCPCRPWPCRPRRAPRRRTGRPRRSPAACPPAPRGPRAPRRGRAACT
jgi:hypothetical protein